MPLFACQPLAGSDTLVPPARDDDAAAVLPCQEGRAGSIQNWFATDDGVIIAEQRVQVGSTPAIYYVHAIDAATGELLWSNSASQGNRIGGGAGFGLSSGGVVVLDDAPATAPGERPVVVRNTWCVSHVDALAALAASSPPQALLCVRVAQRVVRIFVEIARACVVPARVCVLRGAALH
jgi:hypothetical protein